MTFRPSREEDYLGSYLRRHVFQHLFQRELTFDTILGRSNEDYDPEAKVLLNDDHNPLPGWQDEAAPHHWQCEFFDSMCISLSTVVFLLRTSATSLVPVCFRTINYAGVLFSPLFLIQVF